MNHGPVRKLKFLFIAADPYPTFRADVAILFGKEFAARGHAIDWLMQDGQETKRRFVRDGCFRWWLAGTRREGGRARRAYKHWLSFLNDLRAFSLCREEDYDFVQVKDKFLGGLIGLAAAKLNGSPFVYWLSWPFPEASLYMARVGMARYPFLYRLRGSLQSLILYKVLLRHAVHIFVQSERMREDLADKGVPLHKMTAVPMGVDLDEIGGVKQEISDAHLRDIVYLGALGRGRRVEFLVHVFARVFADCPEARLVLVGGADDPEDIECLRSLSEDLGVSGSVVFTGFLPRTSAQRFVKSAYVAVSPFYPTPILQSTSPTKLVEYLALGKAVVANDHPEQSRVIEGSGAGICVPYDVDSFAAAILSLLKAPSRVARMGEYGKAYVENNRDYRVLAGCVETKYYRMVLRDNHADNPHAVFDDQVKKTGSGESLERSVSQSKR